MTKVFISPPKLKTIIKSMHFKQNNYFKKSVLSCCIESVTSLKSLSENVKACMHECVYWSIVN